jgi:hypothetical protein
MNNPAVAGLGVNGLLRNDQQGTIEVQEKNTAGTLKNLTEQKSTWNTKTEQINLFLL